MLKRMSRTELNKMCGFNAGNWDKNRDEVYAYLGANFKKVTIKKTSKTNMTCFVEFKDGVRELPRFKCFDWRGKERPDNVIYEDLTDLLGD